MDKFNRKLKAFIVYAMLAALPASETSHAGGVDGGDIEVVFPDRAKAVIKEGTFPSLDSLRNMAPGLSKNQVYELLGRPHFREGVFGVREWNYIFNFRKSGKIVTCQYKVFFGADKSTQSAHWLPSGCATVLDEQAAPPPAAAPVADVVSKEPARISLSGDALFAYSRSGLQDILEDGRAQLDAIAGQLKSARATRIQVIGYTDRIGNSSANLALSLRRANTVREYLVRNGISAGSIVARGAGESATVTKCPDSLSRPALVACLQPDRRVELVVSYLN